MEVYVGSGCNIGRVRKVNQDSIGVDIETGLFIVADGAGGYAGGEIASNIIVTLLKNYVSSSKPNYQDRINALIFAIKNANERIFLTSSREVGRGMASTVTALLIGPGRYFIAHVGDSRAYLIREGKLIQITRDHSLVQQLVDSGIISPTAARTHERRNEITRAVGIASEIEIDTYEGEFQDTDALLLCSDGLWAELTEDEIMEIISTAKNPQEACDELIKFANEKGGRDNISVIIAAASPTIEEISRRRKVLNVKQLLSPLLVKGIAIGMGAFALILLLLFLFSQLVFSPFPKEVWIKFNIEPNSLEVTLKKNSTRKTIINGESLRVARGETLVFSKLGFFDTSLVLKEPFGKECNLKLRPRLVLVNFVDLPQKTKIFIDGKNGRIRESLPFGIHELRFEHPDYYPLDTFHQIDNDDPIFFRPLLKEKPLFRPSPSFPTADLIISGFRRNSGGSDIEIQGAEIWINKKKYEKVVSSSKGGTRISGLETGKWYEIELRKKGKTVGYKKIYLDPQKREPKYFADDFKK